MPRPTEPREGNLVMAVSERGDRRFLKAQLLENGRDLLPPLLKAQVTNRKNRVSAMRKRAMLSSSRPNDGDETYVRKGRITVLVSHML